MAEFDSIKSLAKEIKSDSIMRNIRQRIMNNTKISLLYAFNSTGKTRLSEEFSNYGSEKTLCFNAFVEDLFAWDNKSGILKIDINSSIIKQITTQGLENDIKNNFRELIDSKMDPVFNLEDGEISFDIVTGDDKVEKGIKISRGEESAFVWSVFYSILLNAIDTVNDKKEDRSSEDFNRLEYIIIDDPVSSMDDKKIVRLALGIVDLIKKYKNESKPKLKFIITTHHPLFFNILFNSFKKKKYDFNGYVLSKINNIYELEKQGDTPFSYHVVAKNEIQNAIKNNRVEKQHFNLFRSLLEKTSTFLGYSNWTDCLSEQNQKEFITVINLHSHGRISDLEYRELSTEDINLFKNEFSYFMKKFNWKK